VRSIAGVKGGYELARRAEDISFWDIIEAIEGASYFSNASKSEKNIFVDDPGLFTDKCPCLIKVVIQEAEDLMRERLKPGRSAGCTTRWRRILPPRKRKRSPPGREIYSD